MEQSQVVSIEQLPADANWLHVQPLPIIAYGKGQSSNADVIVESREAAEVLAQRIERTPIAALTLVQVLRAAEQLPDSLALDVESFAYSTLQSGPEFHAWKTQFEAEALPAATDTPPILMTRHDAELKAVLNRPLTRNAITVEMRDALLEVFDVLAMDSSITSLTFSANGACFSSGGELREFGSLPDPATAHWVRTVHSPARQFAIFSEKIRCQVHGACIGSGLELPAFAKRLVAKRKTFFHMPELEMGLIPGAGGTVSLSRRMGRQRTVWMLFSGKRINTNVALAWGLIDEITDD